LSLFEHYNDEQLVTLLSGSEGEKAFEELYNRYFERLIVHAKLKLKNELDAEEIVQQVFIELWKKRSRLQLKYSFYTYISSAVKFEILDLLAYQQKKLEADKLYAERMSENRNNLSLIQDELAKLPEKTQIIFTMNKLDKLTGKEIAKELNISPKTVEAHVAKALKHLKSSLGNFLFSLL
jgi:RNA polymerase sigma-70 factor (ECF subfamily)